MSLTPKQEHFCRLIASGKDYTTAYLEAYDWNGGQGGAYTEAIKLANRQDIQERIQALQKPLQIAIQKDSINSRQSQIEFIKSRIEHCIQTEDENSLIRWNEQLNKIYNLYKDTEQDNQKENTLAAMDTENLQKLLRSS